MIKLLPLQKSMSYRTSVGKQQNIIVDIFEAHVSIPITIYASNLYNLFKKGLLASSLTQ